MQKQYSKTDFRIIKNKSSRYINGDQRIGYVFLSKDKEIVANFFWVSGDVQLRAIVGNEDVLQIAYPFAYSGTLPNPTIILQSLIDRLNMLLKDKQNDQKSVPMEKAKIERSTGIPIVINGLYRGSCGNGYEGKTKELDAVVQKEAQVLVELFNHDIEIRFNSDRESGGAWIKNNDGSSQVGLNAGLKAVFPNNMKYFDYLKSEGINDIIPQDWETRKRKEELLEKLPRIISIETGIEVDVLKDGKEKNYPESEDDSKCYWRHENSIFMNHTSLEDAIAWLKSNVDPKKIRTVKQLFKLALRPVEF